MKGLNMKVRDGKFILTAQELNKLIDGASYRGYKQGILDAEKQMKYAIELENEGTFQSNMDAGNDHWLFDKVG